MAESIFLKSDLNFPEEIRPYGQIAYEFKGIDNPDSFYRLIPIKPGLDLSICIQSPACISSVAYEIRHAPVSFAYMVSGICNHRICGRGQKNFCVDLNSGTNIIFSGQGITGNMHFKPDTEVACVELMIDRHLLREYLEDTPGRLHPDLESLLDPEKLVYAMRPSCPEMLSLTREILHPPAYTGGFLNLFYESRALSLLEIQLTQLKDPAPSGSKCPGKTDLDRIHHARDLLVSDLLAPPTIASLARQCGINEFKLKKEFKLTFNSTIFGYLQQVKMEKAWHLIKEARCSVTEAANAVGYTNVSHFSAAFKRQFHISPGMLKKHQTRLHNSAQSPPWG